jgi:hypothetical protein
VPPIVHGPVLISFPDLNGFEFGTNVRNPYQSLFERKPDDVIANAVAVYYGDFALPDSAAMQYVRHGWQLLPRHPQKALEAAQEAVAASSQGFSANWLLADALVATGDPSAAQSPCRVAMSYVPQMEPAAQKKWGADLQADCSAAMAKARDKQR